MHLNLERQRIQTRADAGGVVGIAAQAEHRVTTDGGHHGHEHQHSGESSDQFVEDCGFHFYGPTFIL